MTEPIFQIKSAYFSYLGKFPALCGVDLAIGQGQKVGIIGANGSGKSTLLHLLDALIYPDKGTVRYRGKELTEGLFADAGFSKSFRREVGMVFQNPDVQLFCPTVKEDIVFGPLQIGIAKEEISKRLDELVEILDIKELLDRPPHRLSIGEKRKVAIASSLIIDPDVLLLDEPTAGLDPTTTRRILDLLIKANEAGKTIITSTHDLHIVGELADIVHVFGSEKRVVRSGTPEVILKDVELLKANNLVHIHSHRHDGKTHVHPHEHLDHHA